MSDLARMQPDRLERMRLDACRIFGPLIVREALRRIAQTHGASSLDRFERAMVERIEAHEADAADLDDVKEFAVEQLYAAVNEVRAFPDNKAPLEQIAARRVQGRSEDGATLEEQLQTGLEDSFPASDPPAVVSTLISRSTRQHANENAHARRGRSSSAKSTRRAP